MTSISQLDYAFPKFSEWIGAAGSDPIAGAETPGILELNMGTATQTGPTNTSAKALSLEYESSFDDTVNEVRIWLLNRPQFVGHTWAAELANGATFPATLLTNPLGGASAQALAGNPFSITTNHKKTGTIYDSTNNRIATILLQLQVTALAKIWDQDTRPYAAPALVVDVYRRADSLGLEQGVVPLDLLQGHLFTFSSTDLYYVQVDGSGVEDWQLIASVKDENISFGVTEEHVEWQKYKPMVTVHRARASLADTISFTLDEVNNELMALAMQTTNSFISTDRTMRVSHNAQSSRVKTRYWALGWNTLGGHRVYARVPRGVLRVNGDITPGGGDFAGMAMTLDVLATNLTSTKDCVFFDVSIVPVEQSYLPLNYAVTA